MPRSFPDRTKSLAILYRSGSPNVVVFHFCAEKVSRGFGRNRSSISGGERTIRYPTVPPYTHKTTNATPAHLRNILLTVMGAGRRDVPRRAASGLPSRASRQ